MTSASACPTSIQKARVRKPGALRTTGSTRLPRKESATTWSSNRRRVGKQPSNRESWETEGAPASNDPRPTQCVARAASAQPSPGGTSAARRPSSAVENECCTAARSITTDASGAQHLAGDRRRSYRVNDSGRGGRPSLGVSVRNLAWRRRTSPVRRPALIPIFPASPVTTQGGGTCQRPIRSAPTRDSGPRQPRHPDVRPARRHDDNPETSRIPAAQPSDSLGDPMYVVLEGVFELVQAPQPGRLKRPAG